MSNNIIATSQFTIIDFNDINISTTQPENPVLDQLWLDTSVVPNILKRWNGEEWVRANYESLEELDPNAAGRLDDVSDTLNNLEDALTNDEYSIIQKTQSGEFKVKPDRIYSIVKQTTEYIDDMGQVVKKEELVSEINQKAGEIYISANNVQLNGQIRLTNLFKEDAGETLIDGSKIATGTISAKSINVGDISAAILNASSGYIASLFSEYANITKLSADEGTIKNLNIGKLAGQEINLVSGSYEYQLDTKCNKTKDQYGNYTLILGEYERDNLGRVKYYDNNNPVDYIEVIYNQSTTKYVVNHPVLGPKEGITIEELKSQTGYEIVLGKDGKYYMLGREGQPKFIENSNAEHLKIDSKGMIVFSEYGRHIKIDKEGFKIMTGFDTNTGKPIYDVKFDVYGLKVRNEDVINLSAEKIDTGTLNANNVTIVSKAGNASIDTMKINDKGLFVLGTGTNKKALKIDQDGLYFTEDYTILNPVYKPILTLKNETVNGQTRTGLVVTDADIVNVNASKITAGTLDANSVTISGGDVTINSNGISINGSKSSINLNNKFIVNNQGVLTATEGNIANWNITSNKIYSESQVGYIELNSENKKIVLGEKEESYATPGNPQYVYTDRIIIGYKDGEQVLFGQTAVGSNDKRINLLFNKQGFKIYNDSETLFNVDIFGNANFAGTINAKGGYFSGSVSVGENGKIKIDGTSKTITVNTSDVIISETGIAINKGQLNINNNFIVDSSGNLTAKSGYIGSTTDGVKINSNGLEIIGNGIIKNTNTTINKDYVEIKDGTDVSVKLGKIGTNQYGLIGYKGTDVIFKLDRNIPELAGWNLDAGKIYKDNIEISSALSQFIIKENDKKIITLGNDTTASLNLYDQNENKILYLDKTGLHTSSGSLHINADGTVSITGSITAGSGSIGGITISNNELVTGSLHITNNEQIWIGPNASDKKILFGQYASGKYGLKVNGANSIEINQDGITSNKFTLSTSTGNVTASDITVNSGTFSGNINLSGNLIMPNVAIGSNVISIKDDSTNEILKIGKFTKDSQSFTGIYIKSGEIDLTNFKVDKNGNITATAGTIGGVTISSNKLVAGNVEINGSGITSKVGQDIVFELNSSGASFKGSVVATSGKIGNVLIENGSIKAGNVTISDSGIVATKNSTTIFSINESGASFSGTINATQGWFGTDSTNSVKISNAGLVVSENGSIVVKDQNNNKIVELSKYGLEMSSGEIKLGLENGSYKFVANSTGVFASAGSIAGWNISSTKLSNGQLSIDSSSEVINVNNKIKIGKIGDNVYGFYSETDDSNGKTITTIDNNGLLIKKNDIDIFSVNKDGNASFYGSIIATGGYFKNAVSVGENGKILIDGTSKKITVDTNKVVIDETGIQINSGSISIGSNFSVNSNGDLVATSAVINGIVNAVGGYFGTDASKISIDSNGLVIGSAGIIKIGDTTKIEKDKITINNGDVLIGKNASNEYGIFANSNKVKLTASGLVIDDTSSSIKLGGGNFEVTGAGVLTAKSGSIAGWAISSNSLSKTVGASTITLDAANGQIIAEKTNSSKVTIGTSGTEYGVFVESALGTDSKKTYTKINETGFSIVHGTDTIFSVDKEGKAKILKSFSVGASENIKIDGANEQITVNNTDVVISTSGIQINKGSINIGDGNFTVDANGVLTAQQATIIGTVQATSGYFGNATDGIIVNSNGLEVKGTGKIIAGKNDILSDRINVKDNSDNVQVTIGYNGSEYGLFAGGVKLTSSGLSAQGVTIDSSGVNINGNLSINLNNKFVVASDGTVTATQGTIGGWTLSSNKLSATGNSTTVDLSNSGYIEVTKANAGHVKIGYLGTTVGLLVESANGSDSKNTSMQFDDSGLSIKHDTDTLMSIDKDGNASFKGVITATGGSFTNAVNVGTGAVVINGNGSGSISAASGNVIIDINGLTIKQGSIDINNGKFSVTTTGQLTAQNATITGTVNATSGYFGSDANKITVDASGLVIGTGMIVDKHDNPNIQLNSEGITAKKGYIGNTIINEFGLKAGGTKVTDKGIEVDGQQSVIIDDGSMIVKDEAGYNVVNIGNNNGSYGITIYGATTVNKTEGSKTANQTAEGKVFTYKVQTTNKTMLRRAKVAIKIS